jgi:cell wall-associated NlpC family hydrolase
MEYEWGGQDHYSSKGIDCSGLVVNCYREALYSTQYVLPYSDATAADLRSRYSLSVEQPQRGDLVFMGAPDSASVTHIAIMDRIESQRVYFIDASTSGDYDGVEYRSYSLDNPKIKGFARALLFAPR